MTNIDYSGVPARRVGPAFSIVSILSIVFAIASFQFGVTLGLILAVLAIVFGAIGVLLSLLPGTRGGIISTLSIVIGGIGIIAAVFRLLGKIA